MSSSVSFADIASQQISFSRSDPAEATLLKLIDAKWVQRLRDIHQTANTRLVYMFSEHSRFGHSLGVAHLANQVLKKLALNYADKVNPYRDAILAAAILHDIGHLAPGSHTAFKVWYPDSKDVHEELSSRIIREDSEITSILRHNSADLQDRVLGILGHSTQMPPWTVQIISGGGWNVDRGNWCIIDSTLAGVAYGQYNVPALIESLIITDNDNLALRENRLDSMMHFAVSRHAMYRQVYQHRVMLAADMLNVAVARRARDLGAKLFFADDVMRATLASSSPMDLPLEYIFKIRESWWRYHLTQWADGSDPILADLSSRLLNRRLFKTIRIESDDRREQLLEDARKAVKECGFDPHYYLHQVSTLDVHEGDLHQSMQVRMENGKLLDLAEADPLFKALLTETKSAQRSWIVLPESAKAAVIEKIS